MEEGSQKTKVKKKRKKIYDRAERAADKCEDGTVKLGNVLQFL